MICPLSVACASALRTVMSRNAGCPEQAEPSGQFSGAIWLKMMSVTLGVKGAPVTSSMFGSLRSATAAVLGQLGNHIDLNPSGAPAPARPAS